MRVAVIAAVVVAAVFAMPADLQEHPSKLPFLGGVLCGECTSLIKNGEDGTITDFDTWFTKETNSICGDLGVAKLECKRYFKEKEQDINHYITTKADPKTACTDMDFCAKSSF